MKKVLAAIGSAQNRWIWVSLAASACLLMCFLLALCVPLGRSADACTIDYVFALDGPTEATRAFAYALACNRPDSARSLVGDDKSSFLSSWNRVHPVVSRLCNDNFDPDEGDFAAGGWNTSRTAYFGSYTIRRFCEGRYYEFSVEEARLELKDTKWQVTDWKEICETKGFFGANQCF